MAKISKVARSASTSLKSGARAAVAAVAAAVVDAVAVAVATAAAAAVAVVAAVVVAATAVAVAAAAAAAAAVVGTEVTEALASAATAIGEAWANELVRSLRNNEREVVGAWPGTMREARARVVTGVNVKLEATVIEALAKVANLAARRGWQEVSVPDLEP